MAQRNTVPEFKTKLAKHIRDLVDRVASEFEDLEKREHVRSGLLGMDLSKALQSTGIMDEAHAEPGAHEAVEPGVPSHMEPGQHEQFTMNPPASPDMGTADPIGSGTGIPGGQLDHDPMMDGGKCPLCGQADAPGSCQCLAGLMTKGEIDARPTQSSTECNGCLSGWGGDGQNVQPVVHGGVRFNLCPTCTQKWNTIQDKDAAVALGKGELAGPGGAPAGIATGGGAPMAMSEIVPEKGGKKIKQPGSGGEVKKNPLGKGDVPMAKPPSGKVPGQTTAPIASNTSKPGLTKGALNPQMKQHAMIDASKAAAGAPAAGANPATTGVGAGKSLTNPNDMSRANSFASAGAGAFQPKGPISSGLDLAPKAGPMKSGVPGPGKVAPTGLKPPTSAARAVPNPKAAAMPKPKTGLFGSLFGKSEKCALCNRDEHVGDCTSK